MPPAFLMALADLAISNHLDELRDGSASLDMNPSSSVDTPTVIRVGKCESHGGAPSGVGDEDRPREGHELIRHLLSCKVSTCFWHLRLL